MFYNTVPTSAEHSKIKGSLCFSGKQLYSPSLRNALSGMYSLKQPFSLFFKRIGLLPASVSLLASEVPSVSYEGVFLMLFPLPGFCLLIQVFTKVSLAQRTLRELLPSLLSCSTTVPWVISFSTFVSILLDHTYICCLSHRLWLLQKHKSQYVYFCPNHCEPSQQCPRGTW